MFFQIESVCFSKKIFYTKKEWDSKPDGWMTQVYQMTDKANLHFDQLMQCKREFCAASGKSNEGSKLQKARISSINIYFSKTQVCNGQLYSCTRWRFGWLLMRFGLDSK